MKSGNLNFLEPSGPLQACNGTDLISCNWTLLLGFLTKIPFASIIPSMHDKYLAHVILLKPTALITGELFFANLTSSPLLRSRILVSYQFRNFNILPC